MLGSEQMSRREWQFNAYAEGFLTSRRGSKLQARYTKLQAEAAKKQEQAAAQLSELQQKLDSALASSPSPDADALQEALAKVCHSTALAACDSPARLLVPHSSSVVHSWVIRLRAGIAGGWTRCDGLKLV